MVDDDQKYRSFLSYGTLDQGLVDSIKKPTQRGKNEVLYDKQEGIR